VSRGVGADAYPGDGSDGATVSAHFEPRFDLGVVPLVLSFGAEPGMVLVHASGPNDAEADLRLPVSLFSSDRLDWVETSLRSSLGEKIPVEFFSFDAWFTAKIRPILAKLEEKITIAREGAKLAEKAAIARAGTK
jgi:hypothetical protein